MDLVDICPAEAAWMCFVRRLSNGDFLAYDTFMVEQVVTPATFVLDKTALGRKMSSFLSEQNGAEKFQSVRFYGHSHVYMGTSASGPDEDQLRDFSKGGVDFYIRAIFNKRREAEFTLALPFKGVWVRYAPRPIS